jgi:hypothetical protein
LTPDALLQKGCGRLEALVAVARGIDPEPLRDRVRSTWGRPVPEVRDELRRLAESIDVRAQHPATLVSLARTFKRTRELDSALRLLRDAQQVYPGDFWLFNFDLAALLSAEGLRRGGPVLHRGRGHSSA